MSRELRLAISDTDTTIPVFTFLNSTDFPIPGVILIGTEKVKYGNTTDREFIDCTRGYLGTTAVAHPKETDVTYFSSVPVNSTSVISIKSDTNSELVGDITLISGTNITLSQVGQEITVNTTGSSSNGWELSGTDTILEATTTSAIITDDNKLYFDTSKTSSLMFDTSSGVHILQTGTLNGGNLIGSDDWLALGADTDFSGAQINIDNATPQLFFRVDPSVTMTLDTSGLLAANMFQTDFSTTPGDTRLLLWDVDTGAIVRVSVGADDSAGTGYKVLRIPN